MSRVLVTGGAGFIGSNIAHRLLNEEKDVIVFDNLSRKGVEHNVEWLKENHEKGLSVIKGDIRKPKEIEAAAKDVDMIFHTAAQVAVTTSLDEPREDFEINGAGSFNVLEAARKSGSDPIVAYTSTNKVFGNLEDVELEELETRYDFKELKTGVQKDRSIDPHTPYGCSKCVGDSYTLDYSRIYGMKSFVFRMSCIYGTRQFGNVDQGWVAHFLMSHLFKGAITIYGDGKQVRDILFVDDLLDAFFAAVDNIDKTKGKAFNMGGGPGNTLSLLELIDLVEKETGKKYEVSFEDWRPADQKVYYSDISLAKDVFGWEPKISVQDGVMRLYKWIEENQNLFK